MDQHAAECFLLGQSAVQLVMGKLLKLEEHELFRSKTMGDELLQQMAAPEVIREHFAQLHDSSAPDQDKKESAQAAQVKLAIFLQSLAQWLESKNKIQNIKVFNLGFCSFMALFYCSLAVADPQKTRAALLESLENMIKLATELNLPVQQVAQAFASLQELPENPSLEKVAHSIKKFFSVVLKEIGGSHLIEKLNG